MKTQTPLSISISLVLGGLAFAGVNRTAQATWISENPPGTTQCVNVAVNDAGVKLMNCLQGNTSVVYYKEGSAAAVQLPALGTTSGGVPCIGIEISSDASAGIISGACRSTNNVWQAVKWDITLVGDPVTLLTPLPGLLGLAADVRTVAVGTSALGTVAGESFSSNGTATPVYFPPSGAAVALKAPLLASNANCIVAAVGRTTASPGIQYVANCPSSANTSAAAGTNVPVLWIGSTATFIVLSKDPAASFCTVSKTNLAGQIMGQCIYGTDTYKVVRWAAGGVTAPVVMANLGGGAVLRSKGVDMNDSGVIAGNYSAGGTTAGLEEAFRWDPSGGPSGVGIFSPSDGSNAEALDIGNNGKVVGNFFTNTGNQHNFHVTAGGNTAIDDGNCSGGVNTLVKAMSRGGVTEAGVCMDTFGDSEAAEQPTP